MREVLGAVHPWYEAGRTSGLATVVATYDSAPRRPGAAMALSDSGEVVGSVSGGCVEAAVYEALLETIHTGRPALQSYGIADDDAFAVGLTCGGTLEVFIEPVSRRTFPELPSLLAAIRADEPVALVTVVDGHENREAVDRLLIRPDGHSGTLGSGPLSQAVAEDASRMLNRGATGLLRYGPTTVFVHSFTPPPRLLVFGSTDFAGALALQGGLLGYRVTLCDARPAFTTAERFPGAHEVVVEWPHRYLAAEAAAGRLDSRTVVAVLTHDPKFDVPLLRVALRLPGIGYIGAMGSRRTHEDRMHRLRDAGLSEGELARLSSPIGLDIGGRTPQETAVSIAAEIIAHTRGGTGTPLTRAAGPIHTAAGRGRERGSPAS